MAGHSLENVIALLHNMDLDIQYGTGIKPTLQRYAQDIFQDEHRRVFSFDREHAHEILSSLRKAKLGSQGIRQIPRLVLVGLVSEYDVFIRDLIRAGLITKQSAATTINRSVSLQELMQFSDINEAKDFIVEREIDSILYDDHHAQLVAINKLFNISIDTEDASVKTFLEICERRNLFTHNNGIVNGRYLAKCKQFSIPCNVKVGEKLVVSRTYFQTAVINVQELMIKLTQFLWRKLASGDKEEADNALNDAALELLMGDDYKLAERILDYGINHTGSTTDMMRRMMVVNYANAIKLSGDAKRAYAQLDKYDWSATNNAFKLCIAAVRDDVAKVAELMPVAVKSGEISEANLRNWPAFKSVRSEKLFQDTFKRLFKKDLIVSASLSPTSTTSADMRKEDKDPAEPSNQTKH